MLAFSPHCAEYQIATIDNGDIIRWPRRPLKELTNKRLNTVTGFYGIALYNDHDSCLREYRRWLELRLGCKLTMKRRPSREYRRLWDAILAPCNGPVRFQRKGNGWVVESVARLRAEACQVGDG